MLLLAAAALAMPAIFQLVDGRRPAQAGGRGRQLRGDIEHLSLAVAVVLLLTYVAGLFFSLKTHRDLFNPEHDAEDERGRAVDACARP